MLRMLRARWAPAEVMTATGRTAPAPTRVRRRRLIFINRYFHPDASATSQMLTDLVQELAGGEFELHVVCSRQLYGDPAAKLDRRAQHRGCAVHRVWSARFGRAELAGRGLDYLTFLISATLRTARLARRGDVVVAMTDPPMLSVFAASVARLRGAALINWVQDVFPEVATALGALPLPRPALRLLHACRNWSLRVARTNVVLGSQMARCLGQLGIAAERQQIIENWADGAALMPRPARWSALRQSLGAEAQFVVQYSGNLGRAHEFWTLLNAALELQHEPGWLFLFVGDGANMKRLRSEAERHRLRNIRFLPYAPREQLGDSLAAGDVHLASLMPALEGLIVPSKFYGILAAGRPVIIVGDPDGELARIVRAADCGAVVGCGDSRVLVDHLRQMRTDPDWLRAAGQRARELFERRYTPASAARKWRAVLEAQRPEG